jgi:uncharacterized membrane protein HdeD (DUF308 family)
MPLLLGVLFIVYGILCLFIGFENQPVLSIFFGLIVLISGLGETTFAFLKRKNIKGWVWFLADGITDFIFGILMFYGPVTGYLGNNLHINNFKSNIKE